MTLILWQGIETGSWVVIPAAIIAATLFVSTLAAMNVFQSVRRRPVYVSFDVEVVKQFCEHLNALIEWSGYRSGEILFQRDDEYLKGVAKKIIVDTAVEVLRFQGCPPKGEEQKTWFIGQLNELRTTLAFRYDTLKRLGLVTEVGYEKYFTLARKQLKETEKQAA